MSKLNIIPFRTTIIVDVEKTEEKTEGGIFLSPNTIDKEQRQVSKGILIKVGDLAYDEEKKLGVDYPRVGDMVYFKKYSGILHFDKKTKKEYRAIQDEDVYLFEELEDVEEEIGVGNE